VFGGLGWFAFFVVLYGAGMLAKFWRISRENRRSRAWMAGLCLGIVGSLAVAPIFIWMASEPPRDFLLFLAGMLFLNIGIFGGAVTLVLLAVATAGADET